MPITYLKGLEVFGSVDHDPGQPFPSYSCGGVPPSTDVEVDEILIDDADEFLGTAIIYDIGDDRGWSDGVVRMIEAYHRITGKFLPVVEEYVWRNWIDDIEEALIDARVEHFHE